MDLRGRRQSSNIEDRRGFRPVRTGVGLSLGGVLFLVVLSLLGINPLPFLGVATQAPQVEMQETAQPYQESPEEATLRQMTSVVLADTEDTWNALLPQHGVQYVEPTMVLFSDAVQSGCGVGQSEMGPFYCPLRPEGVHRHVVLRRPVAALRRAGRLRAGLRDRARGRPSRAEPAGHRREGAGRAAARRPGGRQRPVGAHGTAGRLLRRRVGAPRLAVAAAARRRRRRRRPECRECHRRRPPAKACRRAASCPTRSPTAVPSSACAGSGRACRPARWKPATRSRRASSEDRAEPGTYRSNRPA